MQDSVADELHFVILRQKTRVNVHLQYLRLLSIQIKSNHTKVELGIIHLPYHNCDVIHSLSLVTGVVVCWF